MPVALRPAKKSEQPVLDNLLQYYLHDFSEFENIELDADGRFQYPYLSFYWQDPDRFPFLIMENGKVAGFAFVRKERDPENGKPLTHLAEFFVLRHRRRAGIGRIAATKLWDMFPDNWVVDVLENNKAGNLFWRQVIAEYTLQNFKESRSTSKSSSSNESRNWQRFIFNSNSLD